LSQLSGTTVEVERTRGRIDLAQALKLPHLVRTGQFHLRRKEDPLRAKLEPLEEHFRKLTSTCIPLEKNLYESICLIREKKFYSAVGLCDPSYLESAWPSSFWIFSFCIQ
jgi:hypothetical protein